MIANVDIRKAAEEHKVYLWQIAYRYGVSDYNFSRRLRHELPVDEKQKILRIISELAKEENR